MGAWPRSPVTLNPLIAIIGVAGFDVPDVQPRRTCDPRARRIEASAIQRYICVNIWSMGRREVLVQLDDDLVTRLDRLAKERGTNRSELLRRGAVAVLDAEELRQADVELQAAYRFTPQDPIVVEAAARLATETIPNW